MSAGGRDGVGVAVNSAVVVVVGFAVASRVREAVNVAAADDDGEPLCDESSSLQDVNAAMAAIAKQI
jgi:hypothetical protein